MKFQVIENFIPKLYQEEIKNLLFDQLPWSYNSDVTYKGSKSAPAMMHSFRYGSETISPFYNAIAFMAQIGANKIGQKLNDVVMCRTFLQFPVTESFIQNSVDLLHVDIENPHTVVLYYVIDSDGDTLIVNKQAGVPSEKHLSVDDHDIILRVTPKQGRALVFDGRYYHTAEQPRSNMRCVINFDII
jgi:hypothetical protein